MKLVCNKSGKRSFQTEKEAWEFVYIFETTVRKRSKPRDWNVYKCSCGYVHLTTQSNGLPEYIRHAIMQEMDYQKQWYNKKKKAKKKGLPIPQKTERKYRVDERVLPLLNQRIAYNQLKYQTPIQKTWWKRILDTLSYPHRNARNAYPVGIIKESPNKGL